MKGWPILSGETILTTFTIALDKTLDAFLIPMTSTATTACLI